MIRAAFEEYRREVREAPPLIQALVSGLALVWLLLFSHARELDRLRAAVAR